MKKASDFVDIFKEAKDAFLERKELIYEAHLVYNNEYGYRFKNAWKVDSAIIPPDFILSVDSHREAVINGLNIIQFVTDTDYALDNKFTINEVMKKAISAYGIDQKFTPGVSDALIEGVGGINITYRPLVNEGYKIVNKRLEPYREEFGGAIDVETFGVMKNDLMIDPLANVFNPSEDARYVIVKQGLYSKRQIEMLAEQKKGQKGWNLDPDLLMECKNTPLMGDSNHNQDILMREGFIQREGITLHKVFWNDGRIWVVANGEYIIAELINEKLIKELPVILYTPIPGGTTAYGRMLWKNVLKWHVEGKAAIQNLTAEQSIKNIRASVLSDDPSLIQRINAADLSSDKLIAVNSLNGRPLRDRFFQMQLVDSTPGLAGLYQILAQDTQKLSRISDLQQGIQSKQVRTDSIANAMQEDSQLMREMIVRQTENTLYTPAGRHIIKMLYNRYEEFDILKGAPREQFNLKYIRVRNKSSIEEDRMSRLALLAQLLNMSGSMPYDLSGRQILVDMYKAAGLTEVEKYLSDPVMGMTKIFIQMGLEEQMASALAQQTVQQTQQVQDQQGGAV